MFSIVGVLIQIVSCKTKKYLLVFLSKNVFFSLVLIEFENTHGTNTYTRTRQTEKKERNNEDKIQRRRTSFLCNPKKRIIIEFYTIKSFVFDFGREFLMTIIPIEIEIHSICSFPNQMDSRKRKSIEIYIYIDMYINQI